MTQKLDDLLWNSTLVLVECPECGDTITVSSLKHLDETIQKMWQLFGNYYEQFGTEQDYKKAVATAGIQNQKDRILRIFKERGIIQISCRTCLTNFQQKLLKEQGIEMVRCGNLLIDAKLYRKDYKELDKKIQESQLDRVTFWT